MDAPPLMQRLFGSDDAATFLEQHFLKLPFSRPGGCSGFVHIADWDTVDRLLRQPAVDVLVGRGGQRCEQPRPTSLEEARRLMGAGQTIGLRHVHEHDDGLSQLARDFWEAFRYPVDIHLYGSPAGEPGFGWHYDAEEVFVLQTVGVKEWSLRKNTVNPWPLVETLPADQHYEREIMPVMRCRLEAGDWLYIPGGYWHSTQAAEECVSLSIGLCASTALDVFDFLRTRLRDSIEWRQRLPTRGAASTLSHEELVAEYRARLKELGDSLSKLLANPEIARRFLEEQGRSREH